MQKQTLTCKKVTQCKGFKKDAVAIPNAVYLQWFVLSV